MCRHMSNVGYHVFERKQIEINSQTLNYYQNEKLNLKYELCGNHLIKLMDDMNNITFRFHQVYPTHMSPIINKKIK